MASTLPTLQLLKMYEQWVQMVHINPCRHENKKTGRSRANALRCRINRLNVVGIRIDGSHYQHLYRVRLLRVSIIVSPLNRRRHISRYLQEDFLNLSPINSRLHYNKHVPGDDIQPKLLFPSTPGQLTSFIRKCR